MTRMRCGEALARLWDYLDGDLSAVDHDAVEEHLAFCLRCCGELEFAQELRHLLRTKGHDAIPPTVHTRLLAFLDRIDEERTHVP